MRNCTIREHFFVLSSTCIPELELDPDLKELQLANPAVNKLDSFTEDLNFHFKNIHSLKNVNSASSQLPDLSTDNTYSSSVFSAGNVNLSQHANVLNGGINVSFQNDRTF